MDNTPQQNAYSPIVVRNNNRDNSQNNSNGKDNINYDDNFNETPIPHNIPLKNKLPAQLLLPSDVSSADFDFIISYIGLIRNQY